MDLMAQAASVAGVLALLVVALWWLRRRGFAVGPLPNGKQRRLLETAARLPLGPQHSLHLVRWGEQALLVSCGPGGCALIASRPWREVAASGEVRL